jgi:hypothetical protein
MPNSLSFSQSALPMKKDLVAPDCVKALSRGFNRKRKGEQEFSSGPAIRNDTIGVFSVHAEVLEAFRTVFQETARVADNTFAR